MFQINQRLVRIGVQPDSDSERRQRFLQSKLRAILITYCIASVLNAHIGSPHSPLNPQVILTA